MDNFSFIDSRRIKHKVYLLRTSNNGESVYKLRPPIKGNGRDRAFFITYTDNNAPIHTAVLSKINEISTSRTLPASSGVQVQGLIPIPVHLPVWGFSVSGLVHENIKGAGIKKMEEGLFVKAKTVIIGPDMEIQKPESITNYYFTNLSVKLDKNYLKSFISENSRSWNLRLSFTGNQRERYSYFKVNLGINNNVGNARKNTEIEVKISPGRSNVYLYPANIGFIPDFISIAEKDTEQTSPSASGLTGLKLLSVNEDLLLPLTADLGGILNYSTDYWRRKDFEFYSWSLFPHILIFDTKNYSIQSKLLKRIAFFVEKKGFTGTILKENVIAGLHGYNAHDYRAEDLAGFFNFALENNIELNSYELLLKSILIRNGIVELKNGSIVPGNGGIISISRSSSTFLRRLLLTHESFHGIFFSVPKYREDCFKVWLSLTTTEKKFWKLFLNWKKYDINNEYLVVNEFQAYMFQQREKDASSYYLSYIIPKMFKYYGDKDRKVLYEFISLYPHHFIRVYEELENYLWDTAKVKGGDDFNVEFMHINLNK